MYMYQVKFQVAGFPSISEHILITRQLQELSKIVRIPSMSKADCEIRIGTSGWYYDHWKELFYPAGLAKSKWFEYYAEYFDTVEINNTFYHLPKEQTLQRWHEIAPKDFLYAVKANRYITHIKKLKDAAEPLE